MSTPSPAFRLLDDQIAIDGSSADLHYLAQHFKSALYLCPDTGADCAVAGGFASVKAAFPEGCAVQVPVVPSQSPFVPSATEQLPAPLPAVELYGKFEAALSHLPRPTVIICKSSTRASVVYAAYQAVTKGKTAEEAIAEAAKTDLKFITNEALTAWFKTVVNAKTGKRPLFYRQLFEKESSTYTYLLADTESKEAILIDPVLETVDRDAKLIKELGFHLKFAVNTYCHADHITGTGKLKSVFPDCKSVIAKASGAAADIHLVDGDHVVFGSRHVIALSTPGHTDGCMSYVLDDVTRVFTGDALLIRLCGRTDFQQGSSARLYHSIHDRLFRLPESTLVCPGHDYYGNQESSIAEERTYNTRVTKPEAEFVDLMANLNLPYPRKIDASLPANLKDGMNL